MPVMRNVNPARSVGKPTVQYQHGKYSEDPRIFHGISIKICDVVKAVQLYILLCLSRIS